MKQLIKTIKYIFYRLVSKKMLITVILGLLLFILFNNKVSAVDGEYLTDGSTGQTMVPTQDMYHALEFQYNSAEVIFLSAFEKAYAEGRTDVVNSFVNYIDQGYYVFYQYFSAARLVAFLYKPSSNPTFTTMTQATYGTFAFSSLQSIEISKAENNMVWIAYSNGSLGNFFLDDTRAYDIPKYLYSHKTELLMQFYLKYKFPNSSNSQNYSNALSQIQTTLNQQSTYLQQNIQATQETTQAIQETTQAVNSATQAIQQTTEAVNSATNAINQQTEVITDTNIDSNLPSNLPSDNTQDTTTSGINNIFDFLKNAFTTGTAKDIVIPIPFTNKNFTIQANFLQNILSKTDFAWVSNIINLFWWYVISVFIVKDISSKFTKIKGGDIENIQDNNIKEDML